MTGGNPSQSLWPGVGWSRRDFTTLSTVSKQLNPHCKWHHSPPAPPPARFQSHFDFFSLLSLFRFKLNCYCGWAALRIFPSSFPSFSFPKHLIGTELVEVKYEVVIFHSSSPEPRLWKNKLRQQAKEWENLWTGREATRQKGLLKFYLA